MLTQKKSFKLESFTLECGKSIPVELGYETYGELNEQKNNVILVPHYFSASSHVAGKYKEEDTIPGYWDSLIGHGKVIDTNKFFVIGIDNLSNVQAHNPNVITTGPRSINPETNKRYGMDFPVYTFRDIIRIQHEFLTKQLGIKELHLVIGASAGGFAGTHWSVEFPDMVKRFVGVITNPQNPAITNFSVIQHAMRAIELDPNWCGGNYEDGQGPKEGLKMAIQMMNAGAFTAKFYEDTYKRDSLDSTPFKAMNNKMAMENALDAAVELSLPLIDASHWYYTCKATMLHDVAYGYSSIEEAYSRIKAKVLLISCLDDMLQPTIFNEIMVTKLKELGKDAELYAFNSEKGHMAGILDTHLFKDKLEDFLKN